MSTEADQKSRWRPPCAPRARPRASCKCWGRIRAPCHQPRRPVAAASAADRPRSPERVRSLRSAGVLQAGRDPIDRSQDRLEVATATGIVDRKATQLAQQTHLEVAHPINVRIAQAQAGEELRLPLEDAPPP